MLTLGEAVWGVHVLFLQLSCKFKIISKQKILKTNDRLDQRFLTFVVPGTFWGRPMDPFSE